MCLDMPRCSSASRNYSRGIQPSTEKFQGHQPKWPSKPTETHTVQKLDSEIDKFLSLTISTDNRYGRSNTQAHENSHPTAQPQPQSKTSHQTNLARIRSAKGYQKRREAHLLNGGLPHDGFPDAIFNEAWLGAREHDLASDEEVNEIWGDEEGDDWPDDEDFGDENGDGGD
jgi:hypothetical protein